MREKIVETLLKDAPPWLVTQARSIAQKDGNIAQLLLDAGFTGRDVLEACAAVTKLPPAPAAWLRDPKPPQVENLDPALCRRLGVAPIASVAGRLCIGFGDPEVAASADTLGLPAHTAYLALPVDMKKALALLPLADSGGPTQLHASPSMLPKPPVGPVDDEEPATVSVASGFTSSAHTEGSGARPLADSGGSDGFDDIKTRAMGVGEMEKLMAGARAIAAAEAEKKAAAEKSAEQDAAKQPSVEKPKVAAPGDVANEFAEVARTSVSVPKATEADSNAVSNAPDVDDLDPDDVPEADADLLVSAEVNVSSGTAGDDHGDDHLDDKRTEVVSLVDPSDSGARMLANIAATRTQAPPTQATPRVPGPSKPTDEDGLETLQDSDGSLGRSVAGKLALAHAATKAQLDKGGEKDQDEISTDRVKPKNLARATPTEPETEQRPMPVRSASGPDQGAIDRAALAALGAGELDESQVQILLPDAEELSALEQKRAAAEKPPATKLADDDDENLFDDPSIGAETVQQARPPSTESSSGASSGASSSGAFASAATLEQDKQTAAERERIQRVVQLKALKRFKVERVLGRGGMATVYGAIDTKTGQPCALKVMEPVLAEDQIFVERFRREIRTATSLEHENIVRTFDWGDQDGTYFMASELVDGGTVQALIKAVDRPLPSALVLPIMKGLLAGLACAHGAGIVHRDLKPANLMLSSQGVLKICDFGIGKHVSDSTLTKTGALFGTPAYMSPEQAQGFDLDARSDLYGVGIVIYELLVGANPFAADSPAATMMNIARGQHRPIHFANPTIPALLGDVVEHLLERDRNKRYATANDALEDIEPLVALAERRASGALARATKEPVEVAAEVAAMEARLHLAHAGSALEKTPPEPAEGGYRAWCATQLDPENKDAIALLAELRTEYVLRFSRPDDHEAAELEVAMDERPDKATARRLVEIAAKHRALLDLARWTRAGLALDPNDKQLKSRLERVVGTDALAPFSAPSNGAAAPAGAGGKLPLPPTSNSNLPTIPAPRAKIDVPSAPQPGSAAFDAVAAAAAEEEAEGFDDRGESAEPAAAAMSPSAGSVRPMALLGRKPIKERVRRQETPLEPSQPLPPSPRPPEPRMSMAGLDPALPPSAPAPRKPRPQKDSDDPARADDAAPEGAAKPKKSKALPIAAGVVVVALLAAVVVLKLLEPVTPQPRDDGTKAADAGPAPVGATAPVVPAGTGVVASASATRQAELLGQARVEGDPLKAVGLLSKAVALDPGSNLGREALVERAKRYEAAGDLANAEKDLRAVLAGNPPPDMKQLADEALRRVTSK